MNREKGSYSWFKLKCLGCELHFTVFSWYREEWLKRLKEQRVYCPECSNNKILFFGVEDRKGEIRDICSHDVSVSIIYGPYEEKMVPIDKIKPMPHPTREEPNN